MLKVQVDQGKDYLEYLRPFILQVLVDQRPDPVTDKTIRDLIRDHFGLEIPERAIQIMLKRISHTQPLKKESGVYRITGKIKDPGIGLEKVAATRHINSVIAGLKEFSKTTASPIESDDEAAQAICAFLSDFSIPCLRAFLRGTAIPNIDNHSDTLVVLVSKYAISLQEKDSSILDSFLIVVKGHMLANALLCPDLADAPKTFKNVSFFFDTPLLIRLLGLEGKAKQVAVKDLICLLHNLGANVTAFSHSTEELEHVIKGAADHLNMSDGYSEIIREARRVGTTKSDLLMIVGKIDELLLAERIKVIRTPTYEARKYQIDESAFTEVLKDEVAYHNPRAMEYDINSVRSIYVLRAGNFPRTLERAKAVLVTSNSAFSRAAFEYGKSYEETREVSSVITDFSLANIAWLKAPLGAPTIPMTEVIAFSYAALQPSNKLMEKYLKEIDKLEKNGTISERDHQILRSSDLAQKELMNLTLGQEDALTTQTITETLARVTVEIKKEESQKHQAEQEAHCETKKDLEAARDKNRFIQKRLFWRCSKQAKILSWLAAIVLGLILVVGVLVGVGLTSKNPVIGWILTILFGFSSLAGIIDLLFGFSVREFRNKCEKTILTWLLKRQAKITGIIFDEN